MAGKSKVPRRRRRARSRSRRGLAIAQKNSMPLPAVPVAPIAIAARVKMPCWKGDILCSPCRDLNKARFLQAGKKRQHVGATSCGSDIESARDRLAQFLHRPRLFEGQPD